MDRILVALSEDQLTVTHILNTHGHFDHVGGNQRLKEITGAPICIHEDDAPMLSHVAASAASFGMNVKNSPDADQTFKDGDTISCGNIDLKVLHTPGHSPGGASFYAPGVVFVGDTLFAGSIGRTDFPGGSYDQLIASVKNKLFTLDDVTRVYTGHGPETTIGEEKRTNPFFQ
ncbi:MAG: beta-lactamase domain-containing protein [Candidatus Magnetoglobus multicellularis str. Araruama]|uniref:Beta-lactamase domain-containing protein n=1 Tax=Candidatus Magnetoglobus multicellularis str. Araruama TaxID=890399 RepID=A0A1V1NYW4_9BACT|nr:MAG: beta-lactamase domain-containing protein [Candidatus Magnetoglobus multicellularis str. Araruama]